jgi:NAD-dependent dihydropyrimidine dehydrogenase PreA subunit
MLGTILLVVLGVVLAAKVGLWIFGERGHILLPSTRRFVRAGGLRRLLSLATLHGYIYSRWTNQYIKLLTKLPTPPAVEGKSWLAERYHGKVLTPDLAKSIITIDRDIPLRDLEQIMPYPQARELVLKAAPDVAVYECCCRHARAKPCQPTQVCMIIGQPFVDFMLEHNPHSTRRLSQAEALQLLEDEHKRGHLHSAWFKDAMLGRFYAICNCCKCCCGGINAMRASGIPMLASSGYVARVDESLCTGCGLCEKACPFDAIQVDETAAVVWERCMGCGVCEGRCRKHAVSLVLDERKGVPLDVRALA